jgi:hypothetical protein
VAALQLRLDPKIYVTPIPDQLVAPVALSEVHRWLYDFLPLVAFLDIDPVEPWFRRLTLVAPMMTASAIP